MSIDAFLDREYKLEKSDNLDDFMKALGVNFVLRKVANALSPVIGLTKDKDVYTMYSNSSFKNVVVKFKPGVEFDLVTPDGRKVKSVITIDGNSIKEVEKGEDGKTTVIVTTFGENEITRVMSVDNVTATLIYKRIE